MSGTMLGRREFVEAAAGLAAGMWLPRPALGLGRRGWAGEQLGLGFIGVGAMSRYHLDRFLGNDAVRVLAVCDVDTTRRESAKKMVEDKYASPGACGAYNDHRELLARTDIDAVVIGTPDHWHAIQVLDSCKAGKDIYCEKPLSLTIHEAKAMIDAVRAGGRVFQTGSQQRTEFGGRFRTACELVRNGRIGRVLTVHVGVGGPSRWCDLPEEAAELGLDWDRWLGPAPLRPYHSVLSPRGVHGHFPQWRAYREYSGGTLTDMGAHHFDIAQWALGMDESGPLEVHPSRDGSKDSGARFVYASGVEVVHGGPSGVTFVGTGGMIQVDRDRLTSVPDGIASEPLGESDARLPVWPDHHANWLACIGTRERPICDAEIGARSVTVCHLANLAYWHGRALKWDPARWEFPGDAEANGWRDYQRREGYALGA
jgi:predicted dehydrogenase